MEQNNATQDRAYTSSSTSNAPGFESVHGDKSVGIFVLGLCSLLCVLVLPVAGWLIGLICGIVGLVMASRAKLERPLNTLGQAGFVLSIIGTVLGGLFVLCILCAVLFGLSVMSGVLSAGPWFWF